MKLFYVLIALIFSLGINAQAQQKVNKRKPMKRMDENAAGLKYGMAGCGLGSIVFGEKGGFLQVFAGVTNLTGLQTFGISTGTSNCGEASKQAKASEFIEVNKVAIETDLSRGKGETLSALSEVLDCRNPATFETNIKNKYSSQYPNGGATTAQLEATAYQACE